MQLIQKKVKKDGNNESQLKDGEVGVVSEVSVTASEDKEETKIQKMEEGRGKKECEVVCVEDCEGEEEEERESVEGGMEREGEIEGKEEEDDGDETVSTTSPPVHEIDYLCDLSQLSKHWESTNTQSLGELWYHLLKQVPTVYHTCTCM